METKRISTVNLYESEWTLANELADRMKRSSRSEVIGVALRFLAASITEHKEIGDPVISFEHISDKEPVA